VAYVKATRIAQERTQEASQEAERIKQDATVDSRKAKKEKRYRATMAKLGKLPPCDKICRGEECSGIPCREEEPGFPYEHIDDMVVCQDKAHLSMATRDGCLLFHLLPARKRSPKPGPPAVVRRLQKFDTVLCLSKKEDPCITHLSFIIKTSKNINSEQNRFKKY
jgi:hypothetical protein